MILIAGCGYLGERIAHLLHEAGEAVLGLTHSAESAERLSKSVLLSLHPICSSRLDGTRNEYVFAALAVI